MNWLQYNNTHNGAASNYEHICVDGRVCGGKGGGDENGVLTLCHAGHYAIDLLCGQIGPPLQSLV